MGPTKALAIELTDARFHSTDCPSEWGLAYLVSIVDNLKKALVSIQLIAPASGAPDLLAVAEGRTALFPFN